MPQRELRLAPPAGQAAASLGRSTYVDMAELLKDNMEAERRRGAAEGAPPGATSRSGSRILRAEHVDMAEFLKDNMEAERRRGAAEGAPPGVTSRSGSRILRAEYVDMAELLKDNMEAERRGAAEGALPGATRRSAHQEVSTPGNTRCVELASVLYPVHGSDGVKTPGKNEGAAGLPSHDNK